MADSAKREDVTFTHPAVMTFPNLIEPRAFKGRNGKDNGDPKFSVNWRMSPDHPDLDALKKAAARAAQARWPGRPLAELAFPFASGTKLADKAKTNGKDREAYRGYVVMSSRSKFRPAIAVIENGKPLDLETDEAVLARRSKFFSGAEALASVCFVAYDGVGQNPDGVTCYLQQLLVTGKGERLEGMAGGRSASETFKGYAGGYSTEDVGADAPDDDIPF